MRARSLRELTALILNPETDELTRQLAVNELVQIEQVPPAEQQLLGKLANAILDGTIQNDQASRIAEWLPTVASKNMATEQGKPLPKGGAL